MLKKTLAATGLIIGLTMFMAFYVTFMGYVKVDLDTFKMIAASFVASPFLLAISVSELGASQ